MLINIRLLEEMLFLILYDKNAIKAEIIVNVIIIMCVMQVLMAFKRALPDLNTEEKITT